MAQAPSTYGAQTAKQNRSFSTFLHLCTLMVVLPGHKVEPHPCADSAIVVEQEPWLSRCEPTVAPAPPHSSLVPAHAQPATPSHGLAPSCPGTSAAHHSLPQPRRKQQKTAEPHQLCQLSNDHPSACPALHLTAAPQLPASNTPRQSKPSVCKPPMSPSMQPMG
ncbi:hypothetical protein ABBQ32_013994 [Trebouxia sp. C0010 RCD-2024]